jgi:hypothetical protein
LRRRRSHRLARPSRARRRAREPHRRRASERQVFARVARRARDVARDVAREHRDARDARDAFPRAFERSSARGAFARVRARRNCDDDNRANPDPRPNDGGEPSPGGPRASESDADERDERGETDA